MIDGICAALVIGALGGLVAIPAWAALRGSGAPPRGRRPRRTVTRTLDDAAAEAWAEAWRPDRSADVLRLRRDMRRWIRSPGRLP